MKYIDTQKYIYLLASLVLVVTGYFIYGKSMIFPTIFILAFASIFLYFIRKKNIICIGVMILLTLILPKLYAIFGIILASSLILIYSVFPHNSLPKEGSTIDFPCSISYVDNGDEKNVYDMATFTVHYQNNNSIIYEGVKFKDDNKIVLKSDVLTDDTRTKLQTYILHDQKITELQNIKLFFENKHIVYEINLDINYASDIRNNGFSLENKLNLIFKSSNNDIIKLQIDTKSLDDIFGLQIIDFKV